MAGHLAGLRAATNDLQEPPYIRESVKMASQVASDPAKRNDLTCMLVWSGLVEHGQRLYICDGCKRIRYVRAKHECPGQWRRFLAVPS